MAQGWAKIKDNAHTHSLFSFRRWSSNLKRNRRSGHKLHAMAEKTGMKTSYKMMQVRNETNNENRIRKMKLSYAHTKRTQAHTRLRRYNSDKAWSIMCMRICNSRSCGDEKYRKLNPKQDIKSEQCSWNQEKRRNVRNWPTNWRTKWDKITVHSHRMRNTRRWRRGSGSTPVSPPSGRKKVWKAWIK